MTLSNRLVEDTLPHELVESLTVKVGIDGAQFLRISTLEENLGRNFHLLVHVESLQVINDTDLVSPCCTVCADKLIATHRNNSVDCRG